MHTQTDKQTDELHFNVSEKALITNVMLIFLTFRFCGLPSDSEN